MKHTSFTPALVNSSTGVTSALNLRPDGDSLIPAARPVQVSIPDGWHFLAAVPLRDGSSVSILDDTDRIAILADNAPIAITNVPGSRACTHVAPETLVLMTSAGAYRFNVSADTLTLLAVDPLPAPRFHAVAQPDIPVDMPAISLSKNYETASALSVADHKKVADALSDAYKNADTLARAAGSFCHPVILRARVFNKDNDLIAISHPQILSHPEKHQFLGDVKLQTADYQSTLFASVDIPTFSVILDADYLNLYGDGCSIVIDSSPALFACDPAARASVALRLRSTDDFFIRASLPTTSFAVYENAPATHLSPATTLLNALDRFADYSQPVALSKGVYSYSVTPSLFSLSADFKAIRKALAAPVTPRDPLAAWLACPHSFSAQHVASSGPDTLWADISILPFLGYDPDAFAAVFAASGAWHAAVIVTFADGSSLVNAVDRSSPIPTAFGPVLYYPSPDAVKMDIILSASGSVTSGSYPLSPTPDRLGACYIDPSFSHFSLPNVLSAYVIPTANPPVRRFFDALVATSGRLARSVVALSHANCNVNALAAPDAAQSSWDFNRSRFILFSDVGIFNVKVARNANAISLSRLDCRALASPHAFCSAGGIIYAVSSNGELLRISPETVATAKLDIRADALVHNPKRNELWLVSDGADEVQVLCLDRNYDSYSFSQTLSPSRIKPPIVASEDDTASLAAEYVPAFQRIDYSVDLPGVKQGACIFFDFAGEVEGLKVEVFRRHHSRITLDTLISSTISGDLRSPFFAPLVSPSPEGLRIRLSGYVKSSFSFSNILIINP